MGESAAAKALPFEIPVRVGALAALAYAMAFLAGMAREISTALRRCAMPRLDFWHMWTAHVYGPRADCWAREVVASPPSREIVVRATPTSTPSTALGATRQCLNLGSYNYLGLERDFGMFDPPKNDIQGAVQGAAERALSQHGLAQSEKSSPVIELERRLAEFLGVEAVRTCASGYSTNATTLCALATERTLIVSDERNHASLVAGCRLAKARIRVFAHNNVDDLERVLAEEYLWRDDEGGGRSLVPFDKVILVIEGLYSMEGTVPPLARILELRTHYPFYLWVDEAHSFGALGIRGRGALEHCGMVQTEADVMVGTFSKAFSSIGGFVAGRRATVERIDEVSSLHCGGEVLPAAAAAHALAVLDILSSDRGATLLARLRTNARQLREGLRSSGFVVLGDDESPVVPLMTPNPDTMVEFSRRMLDDEGVAVVVVGFPATSILGGRVRLCVSAAHTPLDIEAATRKIERVGRLLGMNFAS